MIDGIGEAIDERVTRRVGEEDEEEEVGIDNRRLSLVWILFVWVGIDE